MGIKVPVRMAAALLMLSCGRDVFKVSRPIMGTVVNLTMVTGDKTAGAAAEAAFDEISRIDRIMSSYKEASEVSQISRYGFIRPVKVGRETFDMIEKSIMVSEESGGAFDISFASVEHLWNYKKKDFNPPEPREVKKFLPLVNYKNIEINRDLFEVRFRKKGMKIGLGGIAKGYSIKRGVEVLKQKGVSSGIVDAGGDLQVFGAKSGGPWKTGLRHPRENRLLLVIDLHDMDSIATSGDYERAAMFDGKRYHHIIDPRTGYPTETFSSVSVIGPDPVLTDAYATAIFVMGIERTLKFLEKKRELRVILIDLNLQVYISKELQGRIKFLEEVEVIWI